MGEYNTQHAGRLVKYGRAGLSWFDMDKHAGRLIDAGLINFDMGEYNTQHAGLINTQHAGLINTQHAGLINT